MEINMEPDVIPVLDKGYVRCVDSMGHDLHVVNSARTSHAKSVTEISQADARLIGFLMKEGHFSTLRHSFATFEVRAPLMIARQWFKYVVGSAHTDQFTGWNENSRRYITEDEEFYQVAADQWRSKPENLKQGSGGPVDALTGAFYTEALNDYIDRGVDLYHKAMEAGICAEQARLFLPAYGLYVTWWWSCSLQSLTHFLEQRLNDDAQVEIQKYARAVYRLAQPKFPITFTHAELT